ncbi:MAG: sugar phosphate isomerase/epimerase [Microscillaceae bacterium]|jgi:sugar phosphate isomerase/epimerase|nr:sugar phosphate isomerase/epimerase [Microscillaceae bacterium]
MQNRRQFVKTSALVSAGTLLSPSLVEAAKVKSFGIQLYSLRDIVMQDHKNVLTKLASFGYKEIEAYGLDNEKAKSFFSADTKKLVADLGIKMVGSHAMPGRVADKPIAGNIDDFAPTWKRSVETGLQMGLKYITVPYTEEPFRKSKDDYKTLCEMLSKLAEYAVGQGLKFTYHNHDFEFATFDGEVMYDLMLKECDAKYVNFEMDLFWVVFAGKNPLDYFAKYPGRFKQWHVKDMDKIDKKLNTDVGKGAIDFAGIFKQAKLAGTKHFFIEQETGYNPDSTTSAKNCAEYIKTMKF